MLTDSQRLTIKSLVNISLAQAEKHWADGGYKLAQESIILDEAIVEAHNREQSKLPGHPIVQDGETVIAEFVALVADMRESTKHLLHEISSKKANVSRLERVYYETSALLPALTQTIKFEQGNVTEYLGDGVLGFFKVDPSDREKCIYSVYNAAKNIIGDTRNIVNEIIDEKYSLPELNIGVGLAVSKTLITLVGLDKEKHPKAFGECVFRATKLSNGKNEIHADKFLNEMWPKTEHGKLQLSRKEIKGIEAYLIS